MLTGPFIHGIVKIEESPYHEEVVCREKDNGGNHV